MWQMNVDVASASYFREKRLVTLREMVASYEEPTSTA